MLCIAISYDELCTVKWIKFVLNVERDLYVNIPFLNMTPCHCVIDLWNSKAVLWPKYVEIWLSGDVAAYSRRIEFWATLLQKLAILTAFVSGQYEIKLVLKFN